MNQRKIKWGVLSTAQIGTNQVIPAMQQCDNLEILGIASRDEKKAKIAATELGLPKCYGSYEEMLDDPEIEAVYNPLPNHLHYEWTKKAIESGKHVLCEKPMTLHKHEITELIKLRDKNNVKVGEAFMVHTHPQWQEAVQRIRNEELGALKAIQCFFSYFKTDPSNIRNILEYGGGAIWDIGCYPIHTSRFAFGEEPRRVLSTIDRDPELKVDRLGSVILDFPSGQCVFTVSTQAVAHQRMMFFGDKKKMEITIPFNAPDDRKCKISIQDGDLFESNKEEIEFDICNQYTIQGEKFSDAIISDSKVPVSLEDAFKNTAVIEAIFESEKTKAWINL